MVGRIPLRNRDGDIVDYATVSDEDFERVNQYRWSRRRTNSAREDYYVQGVADGVQQDLHRFLMGRSPEIGLVVDHIDHNGRNNTRENLRFLTAAQNSQNRPLLQGGSSQYVGVSYNAKAGKWTVMCGRHFDGSHSDEVDAGKRYDRLALQKYGPGAMTNGLLSDAEREEALAAPFPTKTARAIKGYTYDPCRGYIAKINIDGRTVIIGTFDTPEEAEVAYISRKQLLYDARMKAHQARPIDRTDDGTAVIRLHNRKKELVGNCLVDDEDWHRLSLFGWCSGAGGYANAGINGTTVLMHRMLMHRMLMPGVGRVDHRDRNKINNQKSNLRSIDASGNSQNRTVTAAASSSFLGVSKTNLRWRATIMKDGKRYYLGMFPTELHAARAYNSAALELYDDPYLNDVPDVIPDAPEQARPQLDVSVEEILSRKDPLSQPAMISPGEEIFPSAENANVSGGSTVGKRSQFGGKQPTSRFLGVSRNISNGTVYWTAEVRKDGEIRKRGGFRSEEEAALVRNEMALEMYDDPRLNVVTPEDIPEDLRRRPTFSKYTGVTFDMRAGKWAASISHKKKSHFLGHFLSEHQAALKYNEAALKLGGKHKLNVVPAGTVLPERPPELTDGVGARKRENCQSTYIGVTKNGANFSAVITVNGKKFRGGTHKLEINAARAVNALLLEHRENPRLNVIPETE